jgi:hypothetical protein
MAVFNTYRIYLLIPILTPFFLYPFPPLSYHFHPSYLSSVFIRYFSPPLSLPLSHFATSIPHVFDRLTLSFPSVQYLFPLSSFSHLNLAIIFLFLLLTFPRYSGISSVSYSLLYLDSLILSLPSCLSVSLSLSLSSALIHLPSALNLSTSSLAYPFLL